MGDEFYGKNGSIVEKDEGKEKSDRFFERKTTKTRLLFSGETLFFGENAQEFAGKIYVGRRPFPQFFEGFVLAFLRFLLYDEVVSVYLRINWRNRQARTCRFPHRGVFAWLYGSAFGSVKRAPESSENRAAGSGAFVSARNCNRRKHFHEV